MSSVWDDDGVETPVGDASHYSPAAPEMDKLAQIDAAHLARVAAGLTAGGKVNPAAFDRMREGALVFDSSGKVLDINPSAFRLTGYSLDNFPGTMWQQDPMAHSALQQDRLNPESAPWRQALLGQSQDPALFYVRHKEGYAFPVMAYALPFCDSTGRCQGVIEIFDQWMRAVGARKVVFLEPEESFQSLIFSRFERPEIRCVRREMSAAFRSRQKFGLVRVWLEEYNDLGSRVGQDGCSEALAVVGETIRQCLRRPNLIVQWAQDRFLVCLQPKDESDLEAVGRHLNTVLPLIQMAWWGQPHSVRAGVASRIVSIEDGMPVIDSWARS